MATITVLGRGEVSTAPDEASLALVIDVVRPTAPEALAEVAERASALVVLLDELGVGPSARQTTGLSVSEEGEHRDGTWQLRGYRASERVTATTGDSETVGRLVAEAVERVGARVDGPWWAVSADNPARAEALKVAASDARRRGEALAAGLGVRLGALVEAVETGAHRPEPRGPMMMRAMDADYTLPVEAGESTLAASVSVTYQVEAT